jgi:hypothetical protein
MRKSILYVYRVVFLQKTENSNARPTQENERIQYTLTL